MAIDAHREAIALYRGLGEMYELGRAEEYLRRQHAFAQEHDPSPDYSISWLALVDVYRGRWDRATERARSVLGATVSVISRSAP